MSVPAIIEKKKKKRGTERGREKRVRQREKNVYINTLFFF